MKRLRELMFDRGGLLGLVVLIVYAYLAPTHVVDGDNAEFSTLGTIGGIAHPSGYPLYLLILRGLSWVPAASPAHAAALATTAIGAAAIVMLHAACRAWGAKPLAATIACAMFAAAPVVMRLATEAEVFALNNLIVAAVLWLAAPDGPVQGAKRTAALGLVAGLGLANHLTCALVAPVGIYGVVCGVREASGRKLVAIALAAAGLVIGLLPYLYAFATPETALSWGKVNDLGDLVHLATRADYGTSTLVAHGQQAAITDSLAAMLATISRAWLWAPFALALGLLGWRIAAPRPGTRDRWAWGTLALAWFLAGPVLMSQFNAAPEGIGLYIVRRFHVLPTLLLALPVAVGFTEVARWLPERVRAWHRPAAPIAATLGFLAFAGGSLSYVQRVHTGALEAHARNMLRALQHDAVVIDAVDAFVFSWGYLQYALGERQDVTIVAWGMMSLPWYRHRVAERGCVADAGPEPAELRLVRHLLATGRPVFIDPGERDVLRALPAYPFGTLMHVTSEGALMTVIDAEIENRSLFAGFDLKYSRPGPDDEWATLVHQRYAQAWQALGHALQTIDRERSAAAYQTARDLGPAP